LLPTELVPMHLIHLMASEGPRTFNPSFCTERALHIIGITTI